MSDYALVTAPQCITGEEFLFKCQMATFSPDGFYRWMEKVWQLEDFFFVESFLLLLKPFCFNGNILCSVILLKKQKVFQLQAGFMYVVSSHRRSLKREDTSRMWWKEGEELHVGFPQSLWLLWDIGVPLCVCLADQAVCSSILLCPWPKWQKFCFSEEPQHCWDLKHATRQEKSSLTSSPCGLWPWLSSQGDDVVLIFFHAFSYMEWLSITWKPRVSLLA